jgi:hypothetical protein
MQVELSGVIAVGTVVFGVVSTLVGVIAKMAYGRFKELQGEVNAMKAAMVHDRADNENAHTVMRQSVASLETGTADKRTAGFNLLNERERDLQRQLADVNATIAGFGASYPTRKEVEGMLARLEPGHQGRRG